MKFRPPAFRTPPFTSGSASGHATGTEPAPEHPVQAMPGSGLAAEPAPDVLTPGDIALIRASAAAIEPMAGEVTVYFYAILFARYPEVRELFPANMDVQRDRLLRGLLRIVELVDDPDNLVYFCTRLGRDHRKFGALSAHYPAVGTCLIEALGRFASRLEPRNS